MKYRCKTCIRIHDNITYAGYYDPNIGRFLTQDSYRGEIKEPDTWNLYAYTAGNPINYTDPTGHRARALYQNLKMAIRKFADEYNLFSIHHTWEYGTFFYKKGGKYAYFLPWTDRSRNSINVSTKVKNKKSKYNIVATIHTHPYVLGYDYKNFSPADTYNAKLRKMDNYIVTADGKIKRYNYKNGHVTTLEHRTYHDKRTQKKGHKCKKCAYWPPR